MQMPAVWCQNTVVTIPFLPASFLRGFGIYNILHMLLSGLVLMGVIMQSLVMGYVLPAAQCDLHLTLGQRGWLAAIPFLGNEIR
ncbi:jg18953 [Pararge aegeria aegeria]|uniref:Jg18953 protein n=1 Tax=Pararge aegeria aegeria TaxID=348720 RepID=A0A8S4SPS1_9NEOP|nr:jg18953 [Pararge aegeria aegeria]